MSSSVFFDCVCETGVSGSGWAATRGLDVAPRWTSSVPIAHSGAGPMPDAALLFLEFLAAASLTAALGAIAGW